MNDLVSIIIPVYNVEAYLKKCVDSVLAQTYTNIEVILVDDGSPDNCPSICDEYARIDSRIKVIHKENEGVSSARNTGIAIAGGAYLWFVDSDDYLDYDLLNSMLNNLKQNRSDIVICNMKGYDETGNYLPDFTIQYLQNPINDYSHAYSSEDVLSILAVNTSAIFQNITNKLIRKETWGELRFPNYSIGEDAAIVHHLFHNANSISFLDTPFYRYLVRKSSAMRAKKSTKNADEIDAYLDRIIFFYENNMNDLARSVILDVVDRYTFLAIILKENKFGGKAILKRQKKDLNAQIRKQKFATLPAKYQIKLFLFAYFYPAYHFIWKRKNAKRLINYLPSRKTP